MLIEFMDLLYLEGNLPKIHVSKLLIVGANKTLRKVFLTPQTQICQLLLSYSSLTILRFYLMEAEKTMSRNL